MARRQIYWQTPSLTAWQFFRATLGARGRPRFYPENSVALATIGPYFAEFLSSPGQIATPHRWQLNRIVDRQARFGYLESQATKFVSISGVEEDLHDG